jgi:hypothetical protein
MAGVALAGCGDSTKPAPVPVPLEIPSFVVVGDSGAVSHLYRVQLDDSSTPPIAMAILRSTLQTVSQQFRAELRTVAPKIGIPP